MNSSSLSSRPFSPAMELRARVSALRKRLEGGDIRAAVIGGGASGEAALDLLRAHGATVGLFDDREVEIGGLVAQPIDAEALEAVDLVVLSPGVPRKHEQLRPSIEKNKVVGEIELASWFVKAPMIGITGTNGKSTTTALIAEMVAASGRAVFAGGNLGEPLSRLALSEAPVDVAVVELSSYQLESIVDAKFRVAVWLNLAPDHTDRYDSLEEYAGAKRRLIERRAADHGVAVINAKDRVCSGIGIRMGGPMRWFASATESDLAGPFGTKLEDKRTAIRSDEGEDERYALGAPWLVGQHNLANACAAIETARSYGIEPEHVQAGLDAFEGLPHRLQLVRSDDDVRWFNDSKATNIASTETALAALEGRKVVWIAGGRDKGAPWTPLTDLVRSRVTTILTIGEAAPIVAKAFESVVTVESCETLERAVHRARQLVAPGTDVLLAPACASFDQFDNYAKRGDAFIEHVRALS